MRLLGLGKPVSKPIGRMVGSAWSTGSGFRHRAVAPARFVAFSSSAVVGFLATALASSDKKEVRGVKWGNLKLRIIYVMMLVAGVALAAGANAKWS